MRISIIAMSVAVAGLASCSTISDPYRTAIASCQSLASDRGLPLVGDPDDGVGVTHSSYNKLTWSASATRPQVVCETREGRVIFFQAGDQVLR
ncbi:MAG TPA: hypothetical protein VN378_01675 [Brevundimonas sp.]|nr:hypothetical protein [Brevundimonas sp.]